VEEKMEKKIKKKKITLLILTALMLSSITIPIGNSELNTIVDIENIQVTIGETSIAAITIKNIVNFGSCDLTISWDPTVLQIVDIIDGNMYEFYYYFDNDLGILNITAYTLNPLTDDLLQISEIIFQPTNASQNGDIYLVKLEQSELLTAEPLPLPINHVASHATVSVVNESYATLITVEDIAIGEQSEEILDMLILDVENLGSFEISLSWDPSLVSVVDVKNEGLDSFVYYVDNDKGLLNITGLSINGITTNMQTIAQVVFHALDTAVAGDISMVVIEHSILLTADPIPELINHSQIHGTITIFRPSDVSIIMINEVNIEENGEGIFAVSVINVTNLGSCELSLSWNPQLGSIINVTDGVLDSIIYYINNDHGFLNITGYSMSGLTTNFGNIAQVLFQVSSIPVVGDTIPISIVESLLLTAEPFPSFVNHSRIHGVLSIVSSLDLTANAGGPYSGEIDEIIQLDGTATGGVEPYNYAWDLDNDGLFDDATGAQPTYDWGTSGRKTIRLQVTDSSSPFQIALDSTSVRISKPTSGDGGTEGGGSGGTTQNIPPKAIAVVNPVQATVNELISYDASNSSDDGVIQIYTWDFGDGTTGSTRKITHSYQEEGTYLVLLTVTDDQGLSDTIDDPIEIIITQANNPPSKPVIVGPIYGKKNVALKYTITVYDPDANDTLDIMVDWDDGSLITNITDLQSGVNTTASHIWNQFGLYTITLYAEDNDNARSSNTMFTIAIDVHQIDDIIKGLLIDQNSDGIFDIYQADDTGIESAVSNYNDSWYLIDVEDDGTWDFEYDILTKTLKAYKDEITEQDNIGLYLLILLIILIFIILGYIVYKKDKDKKKRIEEEKKREEEQRKIEEQKLAEEKKKKNQKKKETSAKKKSGKTKKSSKTTKKE
jgi:chitodextrinase